MTANQQPPKEENHQKKIGLDLIAAGVAGIALGAGLIYAGAVGSESGPRSGTCPIEALNAILRTRYDARF